MRLSPFLLVLLVLLSSSVAVREIPYGAVIDGTLDAIVEPASAQPENRMGSAEVAAEVRPGEDLIMLHVAERQGHSWRIFKEIGSINETSFVYFNIDVTYAGESEEVRYYMLIGASRGKYSGKEFSVVLDWSEYERGVRESITNANVLFVPLLGMGMVVLVIVLFEFAFIRRDESRGYTSEYTTTSLFFPVVKHRPLGEVVADLFINPAFMVFELVCVGVFAMLMLSYGISIFGNDIGMRLFILTGIGALSIPLIYMTMAWLADVYEREPLRFMVAAFVWGSFAALMAFLCNSFIAGVLGIYAGGDAALIAATAILGTAVIAPVLEELFKGFGLLVLAGHHEFDDMLDGLLYGFVIGVGFAFLENWFYFVARANPFELGLAGWLEFIAYRLLFNSMAHGAFAASCGAFMGYFKSKPHLRRFTRLAFIPGVFIAITLHALFNISAILDEIAIYAVRVPIFVFNPVMVGVLAVIFIGVFYFATIQTRKRMRFRGRQARVRRAPLDR